METILHQSTPMLISELIPYEYNVKKHTHTQIAGIAESIKKFGFYAPVVIDDKKKSIIIGHGRLDAAKSLGMKEVPVIKLENLTEDEIRALRLLDNRISESDWNIDNLKHEMEELNFAFDDYHVSFDDLYMPKLQDISIDIDPSDQKMESYLHGNIKQITLVFSNEEFEKVMARLEKASEELKTGSNTETLIALLDFYETK